MRLSFKFYPKLNQSELDVLDELSFHTTKLYNIANYECITHGIKSYLELEKLLKLNWHNDFLHSHNYQQCLKVIDQDWKSYFASSRDYKKNPSKYLGIPRHPKYKNSSQKNQVIFTNLAVRTHDTTMKLSLSKFMKEKFAVKSLNLTLPEKVLKQVDFNSLQQIKCIWDTRRKQWYLVIIYKQEVKTLSLDFTNVMAIDLGLDNICAVTFKYSNVQYVMNGKPLKSKNAYYNKEISRLTGIQMKSTGNKYFKRTKKINALNKKRDHYMHDALHQISRRVVNDAMKHKCSIIVIGDLKGIKQHSKIKGFVQIPIQKLVSQIKYKAELLGVEVKLVKEYYTSGVSAYDLEPVDKRHYNINRRVKRGLFKTTQGYLVNSDINGSLNIMRRYDKNVVPMVVANLIGLVATELLLAYAPR